MDFFSSLTRSKYLSIFPFLLFPSIIIIIIINIIIIVQLYTEAVHKDNYEAIVWIERSFVYMHIVFNYVLYSQKYIWE